MRRELGKYFLDISKLVFGGVVLSQILGMTENKLIILFAGVASAIGFVILGLFLFKSKKK